MFKSRKFWVLIFNALITIFGKKIGISEDVVMSSNLAGGGYLVGNALTGNALNGIIPNKLFDRKFIITVISFLIFIFKDYLGITGDDILKLGGLVGGYSGIEGLKFAIDNTRKRTRPPRN